jgi:hypothetical protein
MVREEKQQGDKSFLPVLVATGTAHGHSPQDQLGRERPVIMALPAVPGADLIVIAVPPAGVLGRRRWLRREPDAVKDAIRVTGGSTGRLPAVRR